MFRKKIIWLVVLLVAISLSTACDQADEANKFVDEANAAIEKAKTNNTKISSLTSEVLGDKLVKAEDASAFVADNKAKFDELISLNDQNEKGLTEASAKFEQASKVKVDEKFKEYVGVKAQELKKRAEIYKSDATLCKAMLAEKDNEKINKLIEESNKKTEGLVKEADDLKAKAEKIIKDNPSVFKQ